jgi:hypothetical protein
MGAKITVKRCQIARVAGWVRIVLTPKYTKHYFNYFQGKPLVQPVTLEAV